MYCFTLRLSAGKSVIAADMAKKTTDNGKRVLFLIHRQELADQIKRTFEWWDVDMNLCRVGMVQTITRRVQKIHKPGLIIVDEGHHGLANGYKNILSYFSDVHSVSITATPIRLNGGGLGDVNDKLIVGVNAKWLIENKYLAPFKYYAPTITDLTGLHVQHGEYITEEVVKALNTSAIYGDVIAYYRQLSDNKKAICYCASVEHSKAMAEQFSAAGIPASHVDGETPKDDRKRIVNDFRIGKIKILCNCEILGEGMDIADCETVILLRPTKSLSLYIQQSMRSMRYLPDKEAIIIDHVGNYARFGLPDQDREWNLTPKKVGKKEESEIKVRQCPECYFVHEAAPVCPHCGFVYPIKGRTLDEIKETRLEQITGIVLDYTTPDSCGTLQELQAYGKNHGFRPGWSFYQAKRRGII